MKLLRLKLNAPFRGLPEGFELRFLQEWSEERIKGFFPYCFVGLNGSGKSNVLEALAAIFYHVECMYLNSKPEGFEAEEGRGGYSSDTCNPDAFELEYLIPTSDVWETETGEPYLTSDGDEWEHTQETFHHIRIEKQKGKSPEMFQIASDKVGSDRIEVGLVLVGSNDAKKYLPDFVVAYSSGENEILSLPFFKMRFIQFDEYRDKLLKAEDYREPEARMVYLDTQFSQAIFLSNLFFQPPEQLKIFAQEIGIEGISEFRIVIRRNQSEKMHRDYIENLPKEKRNAERETKRDLTYFLEGTIERLQKCATAHFYDSGGLLYLDYAVTEATNQAFKYHFEDAFDLFRQFQMLLTLNLFQVSPEAKKELYDSPSLFANETIGVLPSDQRIFRFNDFLLKKRILENGLYSKSLSDGEHQLFHSIGLCLLFKDKNTLFLLDEPETHLNPDWRAKFVSTLRDCLKPSSEQNKGNLIELLITSHSPFIISDCHREQVRVFNRNSNTGLVHCDIPKINTFGTSVHILTEEIFGKKESIPDLALEKINDLRNRPMETEADIKAIKEASRELGESVEKVLLFRELIIKEDELKRKKNA